MSNATPITPEQAMRPEVISAVEDALEFCLGNLLKQSEYTRHQIAVEILRQVVCASVAEFLTDPSVPEDKIK